MPSSKPNLNKLKRLKDDLNKRILTHQSVFGKDAAKAFTVFNDEIFNMLYALAQTKLDVSK